MDLLYNGAFEACFLYVGQMLKDEAEVLRAPVNMCFELLFLSLLQFVCQTAVTKIDDVCVSVSVGAGSPGQEYKVRKAAIKIMLNVARF